MVQLENKCWLLKDKVTLYQAKLSFDYEIEFLKNCFIFWYI